MNYCYYTLSVPLIKGIAEMSHKPQKHHAIGNSSICTFCNNSVINKIEFATQNTISRTRYHKADSKKFYFSTPVKIANYAKLC